MGTVSKAVKKGGRCLIPVFALGRAQELLLILDEYWQVQPRASAAAWCLSWAGLFLLLLLATIAAAVVVVGAVSFSRGVIGLLCGYISREV